MASRLKYTLLFLLITVLTDAKKYNNAHYDTIVIGLGSSGATAASTLARAGRKVLGLEAQSRIGGRIKTTAFGDGVVEEGAEWIHGTHPNRAYDLALQNNISMIEQNFVPKILRSDGTVFHDQELFLELLTFCVIAHDEKPQVPEPMGSYVTKRFEAYLKEKHPQILEDKDFVSNFLALMNDLIDVEVSTNNSNDTTTAHTFKDLNEFHNVSWHRHGYYTFLELLLDTYNEGPGLPTLTIKLNEEVTLIKWPKGSTGDVEVTCKDGDRYTADNVIVTVSLGVLKERYSTLFTPQLPEVKATTIENMSMGVIGKIFLSFAEPWWSEKLFHQILWTTADKEQLEDSEKWISSVPFISFPAGSDNTVTLWTAGDVTKLVESLPEDSVKAQALQLLRKIFGEKYTIPEPTAILRTKWLSNPFIRGTYSYDNVLVEQNPNLRKALAEPVLDGSGNPKILFAGEATDYYHFKTVHGASDSGYREAMRLLSNE